MGPAGRQVHLHIKSLEGEMLLSPFKGESQTVVVLILIFVFYPPF